MSETFDPYHRWLGIPPEEQPPHHYRLLGIAEFESDREVIDSVAMRHASFLQDITSGPHVKEAQRLLNELAAARRCLLDPDKKAAYDAELRQQLAERIPSPPPVVPPIKPDEAAGDMPSATPPIISSPPTRLSKDTDQINEDPQQRPEPLIDVKTQAAESSLRGSREPKPSGSSYRRAVGGTVAALAVVAVLFLAVWLSRDGGTSNAPMAVSVSEVEQSSTATLEDLAKADEEVDEAHRETIFQPTDEPKESQAKVIPTETAEADTESSTLNATVVDREFAIPAPRKIEGLLLWLDAADRSAFHLDDSSRVITWNDTSGGGFRAEADSVEARPRLIDAGSDANSFVAFAEPAYLSLPGTSGPFNLGIEYTIMYVASGNRGCLVSKGSGDSPGSFAWTDGTTGLRIGGRSLSAAGDAGEDLRLRVAVADQQGLHWFIDGNPNRSHSDFDHGIQTSSVLRLGCVWKRGAGPEQFFQGQLAELLIYNRVLNDAERGSIEGYLTEKWLSGPDAPEPLGVDLAGIADVEDIGNVEVAAASTTESDSMTEVRQSEVESQSPEGPTRQGFVVLTPSRLEASGGSQMQLLDGDVVLTDGTTRENEQYHIVVEMPPQSITALRLEALPNESLPGTGPGWGLAGRFSLSEFRVSVESIDDSKPAREISWSVLTDEDADAAKRLVDGLDDTNWTVRRRGETVPITFLPKTPVDLTEGERLSITLVQRENLGCFRLLATSAPDPLASIAEQQVDATPDGEDKDEDGFALFVNLGGDAYEDGDGNAWEESTEFEGRGFGHENGSPPGKGDAPYPLQLWAETAIRGLTVFRATVPDGVYEVSLCFCEQWTRDADRRRFFAVLERGTPHAVTLPFHGPGMARPWVHTVRKVVVKDGTLDIDFSPFDDQSSTILNAIVIRQANQNSRDR